MTYLLVPVVVVLVIMVVVSLVRGIAAFLKGTREELERGPDDGPTQSQIQQNRMMFARIKYQAAAVVVIAILLAFAKH
ncbi:MAG: HIG1 domain-containing protein [Sphingomonadales bacterium]|nr:HIG1 domain-containing protein [Sphingomonadales bacterium]